MRAIQNLRAIQVATGEHKRKLEGNAGGNGWTAGDRALSHTARLFYPTPDNDKMPVPEYSVSPMIHHSARSSALQHAIPACNGVHVTECGREAESSGSPEEASLVRRRLVLLMLLGPRCRRTNRRRPSVWYEPRLGSNRTHRSAVGLRIAGPGRLVYHHLPWWSCWVSRAPLHKQTDRLISNRIMSC